MTASGKKTTTRAVHALSRFHGPTFTKNRTIQRINRKSAQRRLQRFVKEGRKQKKVVKVEAPTCEELPPSSTEVAQEVLHTTAPPMRECSAPAMNAGLVEGVRPKLKSNILAQLRKEKAEATARKIKKLDNMSKPKRSSNKRK